MNIAVCVKQVPATDARIEPNLLRDDINRTGIAYLLNPYDEFGIEEGLRIKEKLKTGSVTVLTIAPEMGSEVLRTCLALGADQAIHMKDPAFADGDNYATAVALTAASSTSCATPERSFASWSEAIAFPRRSASRRIRESVSNRFAATSSASTP